MQACRLTEKGQMPVYKRTKRWKNTQKWLFLGVIWQVLGAFWTHFWQVFAADSGRIGVRGFPGLQVY
jgi:hypothetical protein